MPVELIAPPACQPASFLSTSPFLAYAHAHAYSLAQSLDSPSETFRDLLPSPCPADKPIPQHGTNMTGAVPQTALEASPPAMGGTLPLRTMNTSDKALARAQKGSMGT